MKFHPKNIVGDKFYTLLGLIVSVGLVLLLLGLVYKGKVKYSDVEDIIYWGVTAIMTFFGFLGKEKPKGGTPIAVLLLICVLPGCTTFKKCQNKFGTVVADSIQVVTELVIPRDSVSVTFKTDTLKSYQTIIKEENRAKVIIQKLQDVYKITADCDSAVKRDTTTVYVDRLVFNETPPFWKVWQNWAIAFLVLLLFALLVKLIGK